MKLKIYNVINITQNENHGKQSFLNLQKAQAERLLLGTSNPEHYSIIETQLEIDLRNFSILLREFLSKATKAINKRLTPELIENYLRLEEILEPLENNYTIEEEIYQTNSRLSIKILQNEIPYYQVTINLDAELLPQEILVKNWGENKGIENFLLTHFPSQFINTGKTFDNGSIKVPIYLYKRNG